MLTPFPFVCHLGDQNPRHNHPQFWYPVTPVHVTELVLNCKPPPSPPPHTHTPPPPHPGVCFGTGSQVAGGPSWATRTKRFSWATSTRLRMLHEPMTGRRCRFMDDWVSDTHKLLLARGRGLPVCRALAALGISFYLGCYAVAGCNAWCALCERLCMPGPGGGVWGESGTGGFARDPSSGKHVSHIWVTCCS